MKTKKGRTNETDTTTTAVTKMERKKVTVTRGSNNNSSTNHRELIQAGELHDCVSSAELDYFLEPIHGTRATTARLLYDVHNHLLAPTEATRTITTAVDSYGVCFVPAHTRHHWASACVTRGTDGKLHATIADSAPSPATARDFRKIFARIAVVVDEVRLVARQNRGSNECGLHLLAMAAYVAKHSALPPPRPRSKGSDTLSLNSWRRILADRMAEGKPMNLPEWIGLINKTPYTNEFFIIGAAETRKNTPIEGAGKKKTSSTSKKPAKKPETKRPTSRPITQGKKVAGQIRTQQNRQADQTLELPNGTPTQAIFYAGQMRAQRHHRKSSTVIKPLATPIIQQVNDPNVEVVIIDDETPSDGHLDVPLTHADLQAANLHERAEIETWLRTRITELNEARQQDLSVINSEWSSISPRSRVERKREFDMRRRIPVKTKKNVSVMLRRAPNYITNNPTLMTQLEQIASPTFNATAEASRREIHSEVFGRSALPGELVSSRIVEEVLAVCPTPNDWTILGPEAVSLYANTGRPVLPTKRKSNIAAVIHNNQHFTFTAIEGREITHADSLNPGQIPSGNTMNTIRRIAFWAAPEAEKMQLHSVSCERQGPNECALRSIDNMSIALFGRKGEMTREMIARAAETEDAAERRKIWKAAWPTKHTGEATPPPQPTHPHPPYKNEPPGFSNSDFDLAKHAPVQTNTPRPTTQPSAYLTHTEVKRLARTLQTGDPIYVKWKTGNETGEWIGLITKTSTTYSPAKVVYFGEFCDTHQTWHKWQLPTGDDREEEYDLPFSPIKYVEIRTLDDNEYTNIDITPRCTTIDKDDDEEPEPPAKQEDIRKLSKMIAPLNGNLPKASHDSNEPLGSEALRWYVYNQRPSHVHLSTWARLEKETHAAHTRWLNRIKQTLDSDPRLRNTPLPTAMIETVMRYACEGEWAWSTISSAISATVAAVRALPIYTSSTIGYDLSKNIIIQETQRYAAQQARIAAVDRAKEPGMTLQQYEDLKRNIKCPRARSLLTFSWAFAARVGDARRLQPAHVKLEDIGEEERERLGDVKRISATFVEGKGAKFWGPYTLCSYLNSSDATVLRELMATQRSESEHIWSEADQALLSRQVGALNKKCPDSGARITLRSIRRGSLITLSQASATERELMLLSGHKRRSTLLLYLGLGTQFKEAEIAAATRQEKLHAIQSGGEEQQISGGELEATKHRPMATGIYSGHAGPSGRRRAAPPELFPTKPPSRKALGLSDPQRNVDTSSWPLHTKDVTILKWDKLLGMISSHELRQEAEKAKAWCSNSKLYGVSWPSMSKYEIPAARLTKAQVETLLKAGKIVKHDERVPISAACRAFTVPEMEKERLRPIFEPIFNAHIFREGLPALHYPSRLQRRQRLATKRYFVEFDFAAFFDQIELDESVRHFFVIRVGDDVYDLTRVPMGSSFSAHTAQLVTWCLLEEVLSSPEFAGVELATMLDNVAFGSDDPEVFNRAIDCFLRRCKAAGVMVKGDPQPGFDHAAVTHANDVATFLGEEYYVSAEHPDVRGFVRNRRKNVEKLRDAYTRLQRFIVPEHLRNPTRSDVKSNPHAVTARQFIGCISLILWLAHTIDEPLHGMHGLLQLYSKIARIGANDFDTPIPVSGNDVATIGRSIGRILENEWTAVPSYQATSHNSEDYDVVCIIDASRDGWGALTKMPNGETVELRAGWGHAMPRSAWAEPKAATTFLEWLLQQGLAGARVAIVGDHIAMASAQRRNATGNGGFSGGYYLNEFFATLYRNFSSPEVFYVEGELNAADRPSRMNRLGDRLKITPCDYHFDLEQFHHPTVKTQLSWWHV